MSGDGWRGVRPAARGWGGGPTLVDNGRLEMEQGWDGRFMAGTIDCQRPAGFNYRAVMTVGALLDEATMAAHC